MLLTEQAKRAEVMLSVTSKEKKKVKFKASTCKASTYIHETEREKGVPKHLSPLKTCKKFKLTLVQH